MSIFNSLERKCEICSTKFFSQPSRIRKGRGKFCGKICYFKSKKGKTPWNKGKPAWWATGENNYGWKGGKVSYHGLHDWIKKKLGQPNKCEFCGVTETNQYKIHWANKSHKYKRELDDWIRLCIKCHRVYDKR